MPGYATDFCLKRISRLIWKFVFGRDMQGSFKGEKKAAIKLRKFLLGMFSVQQKKTKEQLLEILICHVLFRELV